MSKKLLSRFAISFVAAALASLSFASAAFANAGETVTFGVGINNYPDVQSSDAHNIAGYLNVYDIVNDPTLGYYKGIYRETIATAENDGADVDVEFGDMVDFLGFKSEAEATSDAYKTWKFQTPPFKNFGNSPGQLCQTNFFEFDEFLKMTEDYACATSLSVPYTVVSSDNTMLSATTLSATSKDGGIYTVWDAIPGLGTKFDKYNVIFKKGYYRSLSTNDSAMSYVTYAYYNLVGLNEGDWWTFQVVPVKKVDGVYVEVGEKSNVIQVQVKGTAQVQELATPFITSPYEDQILTNYPREAYLSWTKIDNAGEYYVEVACDYCGSSTKFANPISYTATTNHFTTPALAGDNEFRVRVKAVDEDNNLESDWSSYVYFKYDTSGYVNHYTAPEYDVNLAITSWDGGVPKIAWSDYQGDFDGYAMFIREGNHNESAVTLGDITYFRPSTTSYQLSKLYTYTDYTVRILPYEQTDVSKKMIYPGSNTLHFTTGGNDEDDVSGQDLPPAGYEDEVITTFDTYSNPFPDNSLATLEGKAAAELYRRGVIGGFPDGEFKGDRSVNRAELAKFLLLARYGEVDEVSNNGQFSDVLDGEWYVKYVVTAARKGIINGYADGTFRPANTVNVAEFLKMITLTFDLETNLPFSYNDVEEGEWYAQYAGVAQKYELFPGSGNYLNPSALMSRDQVAIAIYQFLSNRYATQMIL